MGAIHFENLSKSFKKVQAVKNINLDIEAGQVYGFLGPNGAGKTTTIRMALDLINPTSGRVYLFGQRVRERHDILKRVGALVEGAAFYPYLTGRKNLEVLARSYGSYDPARINVLLKQAGLEARANRRVRGYSTGMKQRLGLAAALLHDPELLFLDEPTNGLDPAGIQEMRTLIRDLADNHGKTIFLSSHMLNEVEQTCDRVAIINRGEIVREGSVEALLAESASVRISAKPLEQAEAILQADWDVLRVNPDNGAHKQAALSVAVAYEDIPQLVQRLVAHDIAVYEVAIQKQTLEQYFLQVTQAEGSSDG